MQFYCNNFLVKLDLMSAEKSCYIIMSNKLLTIPGEVFRFSDFYLQHEFTASLCYLRLCCDGGNDLAGGGPCRRAAARCSVMLGYSGHCTETRDHSTGVHRLSCITSVPPFSAAVWYLNTKVTAVFLYWLWIISEEYTTSYCHWVHFLLQCAKVGQTIFITT